MNSASTLPGFQISTVHSVALENLLELDLHSGRRLDDACRYDKDNSKSQTEKDNTNASVCRPARNCSTPQGNGNDVENRIPPLGNYKSQSA